MGDFRYDNGILYVGDKRYPCATFNTDEHESVSITWRRRQARLQFESGYSLSIIWGTGTYSTNYNGDLRPKEFVEEPDTVEIAVLDRDTSDLLPLWEGDDTVQGYCTAEFVNKVISDMNAGWPAVIV